MVTALSLAFTVSCYQFFPKKKKEIGTIGSQKWPCNAKTVTLTVSITAACCSSFLIIVLNSVSFS